MPLKLHSKYDSKLSIEVDSIQPSVVAQQSIAEIGSTLIWRGRRRNRLDDFFEIAGEPSSEIHWGGSLEAVDRIGFGMGEGTMVVDGSCGNHLGDSMSAGQIVVLGNVKGYAGHSMNGGRLVIQGNAGDHLGGIRAGEKLGMNRGEIFVRGNVGRGAGQGMRRGTIIAGGTYDELAGWNMIAGTMVSFGGFHSLAGAGMKRGTLVEAGDEGGTVAQHLLPTFDRGIEGVVPVLRVLAQWLHSMVATADFKGAEMPFFSTHQIDRLLKRFTTFHGDRRVGGKGEVFSLVNQDAT